MDRNHLLTIHDRRDARDELANHIGRANDHKCRAMTHLVDEVQLQWDMCSVFEHFAEHMRDYPKDYYNIIDHEDLREKYGKHCA